VTPKLVPDGDPTCVPFRKTRYPVTPTLSVDADHDNVNDVCVMLLATRPGGADGGVVSGHAVVCTVIVAAAETFPAASDAATPST
jgi:hypothetical protein